MRQALTRARQNRPARFEREDTAAHHRLRSARPTARGLPHPLLIDTEALLTVATDRIW